MRIFDLNADSKDDMHTLSATVAWEECDRPDIKVFFRTRGEESPMNVSNYDAFLVACVAPAQHCGERRITIDGAVCPWLVDNLTTMMAYLNHWYWHDQGRRRGDTVRIEAKPHIDRDFARRPRVGAFFSGGVDSFYTLRKNHLIMPEEHPGRIADAIFVHGFDLGTRPELGTEEDAYNYFLKEFEPVARAAKVNIIPVWTNLQLLGVDTTDFWLREFMGPAMGAVAHALSGKLTDVIVASSYTIQTLHPFSSHPLLEPRFSSFNLRVHHDAERTSRVDKVKGLADWQPALHHLRVCFFGKPGMLNCGTCAKCVRTKLELLCANRLHATAVFENSDLSAALVRKALTFTRGSIPFWGSLVRALSEAGHKNLAGIVAVKGLLYYLRTAADLRRMVAWIDRHALRGSLKTQYHRFQRSHPSH